MKLHPNATDLTGIQFGRLTALNFDRAVNGNYFWRCRCSCGQVSFVRADHLVAHRSQSCGCLRKEISSARSTTHGASRTGQHTREYESWAHMLNRCRNPNDKRFHRYGGRGIRVCDRWQSFDNFRADMGACPEGKTLDRTDNNGDYEPGNCQWRTHREQAKNRVSTRLFTRDGVTLCLTDWAATTGVNFTTLHNRLKRGWPIDRALIPPVK